MKLLKEWKLIFNCLYNNCNSHVDNLIAGQLESLYDKQTLLIFAAFPGRQREENLLLILIVIDYN